MPLNSRESLSSRISELGEGSLKDLLVDMNDSSWQWSRNKDSSTSRKRNVVVGGQTVDSASASAGGGSGGSSSGGESGGSSTSSDQIQSNWKEANPLAKAFIKNKPALGSISSYDFSGGIGDVYFDGKEFFTKDETENKILNKPYAVWFSSIDGSLQGTQSFTFGDPDRLGALYVPSLQVMGSAIMGNRAGFWDDQFFTLHRASTGGTVQLTPGYSNTKFIYAHNNEGNATVATDKASFANLAQNGIVFASMLPNTSEDLIYLHTDEGAKYDPITKTLSVENLFCSGYSDIGSLLVTKDSHGYSAGVPLNLSVDSNGERVWSLAQATDDLSKIATHFVVSYIDENNFRVADYGYWRITGLSAYGKLFLSAIPGEVVSSVSALPSNVAIQPLGIADATGLHINITSYVRDVTP